MKPPRFILIGYLFLVVSRWIAGAQSPTWGPDSLNSDGYQTVQAAQWQRVDAVPAAPIFVLYSAGDTLYAAAANHILYSTDGGMVWQTSAPIQAATDDDVTDFLVTDGVWYVSTLLNGCFVSMDYGVSWQAHNTGLSGLGSFNISALAQRGDSIYLSTFGAGVFVKKRTPALAGWTGFNQNIPWGNVQSLTVDGSRLLAGTGAVATLAYNSSPDSGWTEQPFDAFNGQINLFLGAWRDSQVLLGAGTQGLYRSANNGLTWTRFNPGVGLIERARFTQWQEKPLVMLSKPTGSFLRTTANQGESWMALQPAPPAGGIGFHLLGYSGKLFYARTDGLWVLNFSVPTHEDPSTEFSIGPVAPNPVTSGVVHVPVTLQRSADIFIGLYDWQGKLLKQTNRRPYGPGDYHLRFEVPALPTGIYVCTIHVNGRVQRQLIQVH